MAVLGDEDVFGAVWCRGPPWQNDQMAVCYRQKFLQTYLYGALVLVSSTVLIIQEFKRRKGQIRLEHGHQLPEENKVQPVGRTTGDRIRLAAEVVCLVLQLSLAISTLAWAISSVVLLNVVLWGYCIALRCLNMGSPHLAIFYPIVWLSTLTNFHAELVNGSYWYYTTQFIVATILFLASWTATRTGNVIIEPGVMPCPEPHASLLSRATFGYLTPLLIQGNRETLDYDHIWGLAPYDQALNVVSEYRKNKTSGSLAGRLWSYCKWPFLLSSFYALLYSISTFAPTMLAKIIVQYVEEPGAISTGTAWTCAALLLMTGILSSVFICQCRLVGERMSMHLSYILIDEIYSKTLKRAYTQDRDESDSENDENDKDDEEKSFNTASVINLMSVDTDEICEAALEVSFFSGAVFQVVIAIIMIILLLGKIGLWAVVVSLLFIPINYFYSKKFSSLYTDLMKASDERINKTNEMLQAIKVIKYFGWEDKFAQGIHEVRQRELKLHKATWAYFASFMVVDLTPPTIMTIVVFYAYVKAGNELTASVGFTAFTLFDMLLEPLTQLSDAVAILVDAGVSFNRINRYLNGEETAKYVHICDGDKIALEDVSAEWSSLGFKLRDINIEFPKNKLTLVVGPTGSGKTSLLMSLLGEMHVIKGTVTLPNGTSQRNAMAAPDEVGNLPGVAYCAQQPWLLNDSLKNNILFASPYNKERYEQVVDACALTRDLEILEHGDETMVGEKGVVLSGGQKQRISLARAVYSRASILILDDCLSAVDYETAVHIYDRCLTADLTENRSVILVSHNVKLAATKADKIVEMQDGRIVKQGSPNTSSTPSSKQPSRVASAAQLSKPNTGTPSAAATGIKEEERAKGVVDRKVVFSYLQFVGGKWFWAIVLALFVLENCFKFSRAFWLRQWVLDTYGSTLYFYIGVLMFLTVLAIAFTMLEIVVVLFSAMNAGQRMFEKLLSTVLNAETRVFDVTPLGQIMNRFSKDVEGVDSDMPSEMETFIHCLYTTVILAGLICVVNPVFVFAIVVALVLYAYLADFHLKSSREFKRLHSNSKSPLYQHFSQTVNGVSTVRAYGDTSRFWDTNLAKMNQMNRPFYYAWAANQWLMFRVELLGAVIVFGAAVFVILTAGKIDAGLAGLSLSYAAMSFTETVFAATKAYVRFELTFNCVERISQYLDLPQEREGPISPPAHWPYEGKIQLKNLSLRYAPDLPQVVKNVSFTINSHEKVAVVGRTGSGKSTLLSTLFRFVEADEGQVLIDGVNIADLQLKPLRQSLAIIPQDPTLFAGTIRSNLDPFDMYTDEQVLQALRRVHLIDNNNEGDDANCENTNQFENLDNKVDEMGQNLSQGQRQLMCLARALLKKPKILLMDEATASIDYQTDEKIQKTIRTEFSGCTLLTIAHRLLSIVDYDRVLVLGHGELVQDGTPSELASVDGVFKSMCEASGEMEKIVQLINKV